MAPPKPDKRKFKAQKLKTHPQRKSQKSVLSTYTTATIIIAVIAVALGLYYVKRSLISPQSLNTDNKREAPIKETATTPNISDFMNFKLLPRRDGVKVCCLVYGFSCSYILLLVTTSQSCANIVTLFPRQCRNEYVH